MRSLFFLLLIALSGSDAPADTARPPQTHALLINGGQGPANNVLSHLHHLQDMVETLLARGVAPERLHVFSSDGEDPAEDLVVRGSADPRLWLVQGTALQRPLGQADLTNTVWEEMTLRPATLAGLRRWFEKMKTVLVPGDTLLVFVTDHGTRNSADPGNGFIALWKESLSVLEFRALLGHLRPGTRVVNVMSQCYSGAFAEAMSPFHDPTPTGDVCGFYSTTADRLAFGCYPEGRDRDRVGHAFRFIDAIGRTDRMDAAHLEVLATDATPDVPLRTSDLYMERLLRDEALRRAVELDELTDELLGRAWVDRGRWEPEIRLLDRLGSIYGVFSPRTFAELGPHIEGLAALSTELGTYRERWRLALDALRRDNLTQFKDHDPGWQSRLDGRAVDQLGEKQKSELRDELLPALASFAEERTDVWNRLHRLRQTFSDAESAEFRVEIRLAALLRMRTILSRVAARQLLEGDAADPRAARALAALEACEAARIGEPAASSEPEALELEPLPPFEDDLEVVKRVLPSWFGIQFGAVPDSRREELELERGAVVVQRVYEDSAALAAGIRTGDLVVGPPGAPFDEPRRIREWIMGSPRDTPLELEILREGEPLSVNVSLDPYPTRLPALPAPPGLGDDAPVLPALRVVTAPEDAAEPGARLLFFWATWCAPCKAAVPELLAWSETEDVPVIAVTDEAPATVRSFLDRWDDPFPDRVSSDEMRLSHVGYGVSGTPTFVLVGEGGKIRWRQTGYALAGGLDLPDWSWTP